MNLKIFNILLLLAIAVAASAQKLSSENEEKVVENYFKSYPRNRVGRSARLRDIRQNILKRFYQIQEHNRNVNRTFEMELNEMSASSDAELAKSRLGFEEPATEEIKYEVLRSSRVSLPNYWNWAEKGVVQPVQDQGDCGSCYAFAAIGVIESSMCLNHGICVKLSEQEAMECTNGCRGGWDTNVYAYANRSNGTTLALFYRYLGVVRNNCDVQNRRRVQFSRSNTVRYLPDDSNAIRQFLYENGPLFVAFDVYDNFFSYRRGIVTEISGERAGGHAVLLTGYGTENGTDYWILKNSWGSRWGERGYFRVIRGVNFARIESWRVSFAWTV